jgi:FkbM family methyltransferase
VCYVSPEEDVKKSFGSASSTHEAMNHSPSVVIFGAGNLGRRVARAIPPVLFCDNNRALWGTEWEGTPIESPEKAVRGYPSATFIIAIWHPSRTDSMTDRINQVRSLGASNVVPFSALLAEYGDFLLPHMFWERPDYYARNDRDIGRARALMDTEGQQEFDRQMRLRLGNPSGQLIDSGAQYFPDDLFQLSGNEVFVDCGAYDGDTIAEFRRATGDEFAKIVAFEPDPQNFRTLERSINGDPRIRLHPHGTGARTETARFILAGTGSRVSSEGNCEIKIVTLDDALEGIAPTYMKLDIEGSEPATIEGGSKTIRRHRPKMAVCLYHAPNHFWMIPLRLNELLPDSRFTLRTYCADGWDCVCYCIPR